MKLSLKQWEEIVPKDVYAQINKKYKEATGNNLAVSVAHVECDSVNEPLEAEKGSRFNTKVIIKIHSYRHRLIDVDNLFGKYIVDGLRYCGILEDDSAKYVESITCTQEKNSIEKTIITIEEV